MEAGRRRQHARCDQSHHRENPDDCAQGGSGSTGASSGRSENRLPRLVRETARGRAALLVKLAEALEAEQDNFAHLLTEEQGKPLTDALFEMAFSIAVLRYFATLDLPIEVLKEDGTQKVVRQHRPLGVVAAITPWNLPLLLLMIKVALALLAGNTVVAKPARPRP
jgi:acyl-CoA reductase-like NAD-dependent aldehyde dehydrogenase